jgi:protein disulfide-isomerase
MKNNCTIRFVLCDAGSSQELKWHTNVKEAIAIGNKAQALMMFFTVVIGGWCIRLQKKCY